MLSFPLDVVDVLHYVSLVEVFGEHLRRLAVVISSTKHLCGARCLGDDELKTRQMTLHGRQVRYEYHE